MSSTGIAFSIGNLSVRWYGILISLALALGIYLAYREAKRERLDDEEMINILLVVIPSAIVGARLYYVIFNWSFYATDWTRIFRIWEGGLAIHGGIIAGILVCWLMTHCKEPGFLRWADVFCPSLAIGQAIGRWGNFFNQEAYGYSTDLPWAMYIDGAYRHPTFLYESLWDVGAFIILIKLLRRPHRRGSVFAIYLIVYSIGRFVIETFRTDSLMLGFLRTAMMVSIICITAGVVILYVNRKLPLLDFNAPQKRLKGKKKR